MKNRLKGKIIITASKPQHFDSSKKGKYILDEHGQWEEPKGIFWLSKNCKHWLSIQRKKDCIFSRRLGYSGLNIWKWNIKLRLLGREIL